MNETIPGRPKQFLADLALAMRTAAESGRQTTVDECHSNAEAYIAGLKASATEGQASLRDAAADDVAALREQSKAQAQLIREESERRVRQRRDVLDSSLVEYKQAIEAELAYVEQRMTAWEERLEQFYKQLADESDPMVFASLAATMPEPPQFGEPDPAQLVRNVRGTVDPDRSPTQTRTVQVAPEQSPETLPDHWWLDSPVAIARRAESDR